MKLIPDAVNPLAWAGWLCELWQTPMLHDWDLEHEPEPEMTQEEAAAEAARRWVEALTKAEEQHEVWDGYPCVTMPDWVEHPKPSTFIVPADGWLYREVRTALDKHVVFFGLADWGCECRQHFATHQAWRDHLADIVTKILEQ